MWTNPLQPKRSAYLAKYRTLYRRERMVATLNFLFDSESLSMFLLSSYVVSKNAHMLFSVHCAQDLV